MLDHVKVVIDTTKVRLFKQITTRDGWVIDDEGVVIDTTKVRLFKQITTHPWNIPDCSCCY